MKMKAGDLFVLDDTVIRVKNDCSYEYPWVRFDEWNKMHQRWMRSQQLTVDSIAYIYAQPINKLTAVVMYGCALEEEE